MPVTSRAGPAYGLAAGSCPWQSCPCFVHGESALIVPRFSARPPITFRQHSQIVPAGRSRTGHGFTAASPSPGTSTCVDDHLRSSGLSVDQVAAADPMAPCECGAPSKDRRNIAGSPLSVPDQITGYQEERTSSVSDRGNDGLPSRRQLGLSLDAATTGPAGEFGMARGQHLTQVKKAPMIRVDSHRASRRGRAVRGSSFSPFAGWRA